LGDLTVGMTASMRPNQAYDLVDPKTGTKYPFNSNRVWAYIPDSMNKLIADDRIYFPEDSSKRPLLKRFQAELKSSYNPLSSLILDKVGLNTEGTKKIQELFGANVFDYTKPVSLIRTLLSQTVNDNDIILDFFAGSATTANAVLDFNTENKNNTKYILIQLPEETVEKSEAFRTGFKNIADIAKERIRRAAKKIKEENPLFSGDLGFKVFKLDTSNIKRWEAGFDTLEEDLLNAVNHIKQDRSNEDVLFELLLKYGLDLTLPIETRTIAGQRVYSIGLGALVACLDDDIPMDVVNGIGALKEELQPEIMRVVFKDSSFKDDVVKTNAVQTLKRFGIQDIKSL
jgi:adenine-specific DNA-methyltransferase